jgi:hypothetical protein
MNRVNTDRLGMFAMVCGSLLAHRWGPSTVRPPTVAVSSGKQMMLVRKTGLLSGLSAFFADSTLKRFVQLRYIIVAYGLQPAMESLFQGSITPTRVDGIQVGLRYVFKDKIHIRPHGVDDGLDNFQVAPQSCLAPPYRNRVTMIAQSRDACRVSVGKMVQPSGTHRLVSAAIAIAFAIRVALSLF